MKFKVILVFLLLTFSFKSECIGQLFKADFENWQPYFLYDEPQIFQTLNYQSFFTTFSPNVTQIQGWQGYGVHLQNKKPILDTTIVPGMLSLGDITQAPMGGIPFGQMPDSVSLFLRYNLQVGDTGLMAFVFKRVGIPISFSIYPIYGVLNNFTKVTLPISPSAIAPDSLFFVLISGNFINPKEGSFIDIDELNFIGTTQQIPNSSFEKWEPIEFEEPEQWATPNLIPAIFRITQPVSKSTDSKSGLYSLKLENVMFNGLGVNATYGTTGLGESGTGNYLGFPLKTQNIKFNWSYKYNPINRDTAWLVAQFQKYDQVLKRTQVISLVKVPMTAQSIFTDIQHEVRLAEECDTMFLVLTSGNGFIAGVGNGLPQKGSFLVLDDLQINALTGSEDIQIQNEIISSNPVTDYLEVQLSEPLKRYSILSETGVEVTQSKVGTSEKKLFINVEHLLPGSYILKLTYWKKAKSVLFIKN